MATPLQHITVLGSTGSIGVSTLDVVSRHPDRFKVFALTANTDIQQMLQQCQATLPKFAVMRDSDAAEQLQLLISKAGLDITVLADEDGLVAVAKHPDVDVVMAAIVGAAGLLPTLAAAESGKKVLLANKESLVMSGRLLMQAVKENGAVLLPIDSEHNAIFQCLPERFQGLSGNGVRRILLTGSGGPFRTTPLEQLSKVTPDQACAHPNWSMGRKISVDSATMLNKGLELIEACWLFNATPEQIDVVIHPQSVIHSMVEYVDGSVLAQLGNPDMRTPIAHALAWPERIVSGVASLDIIAIARLDFEAPDFQRFPGLRIAIDAARSGGIMPTVLNAANEVAVDAFLSKKLTFDRIPAVIERVLESVPQAEPVSLSVVKEADSFARQLTCEFI